MGSDSIGDAIDFAISEEAKFKEIYRNTAKRTDNELLIALLEDLARTEQGHEVRLRAFKATKLDRLSAAKAQDLKISDYLVDVDIDDASTVQDIMIYAMKSEGKAHQLYTSLAEKAGTEEAGLFTDLAQEELKHKSDLERAYEDLFLPEN